MGKRFLAVVATALAVLALAGCGSAETASSTDAEVTQQESQPSAASQAGEVGMQGQSIGLTSVANARELGGYVGEGGRVVRRGVLLRSAALAELSAEDQATLTDSYHLATVVDFRMSSEVEESPDPTIEGVRDVNLHIMDEQKLSELSATMTGLLQEGEDPTDSVTQLRLAIEVGIVSDHMYVDWLSSDVGRKGYAAFFQELESLEEGQALLFHCTQGKDRTGVGAMLVLSALGVDEQTIMQDYLLTNEFNAERIAQERQMLEKRGLEGDELDEYLSAMDWVQERCLQNVLDWMVETYGSPQAYIQQELGVSAEQMADLQDKFLE